uniref:Uncharacterized protein n=1 Tax=Arundo donax TaxID=35708 RepID=A0A0A8YST8_ARUDO
MCKGGWGSSRMSCTMPRT